MKNGIIALAFLGLAAGCATNTQEQTAPPAPTEAVLQLPKTIAELDFSNPLSDSDVLSHLGLLGWAESLPFTPGARHMSRTYRLNADHLLELHISGQVEGIVGVTLREGREVIRRNINQSLLAEGHPQWRRSPNQKVDLIH
jgi:hypothetical protein